MYNETPGLVNSTVMYKTNMESEELKLKLGYWGMSLTSLKLNIIILLMLSSQLAWSSTSEEDDISHGKFMIGKLSDKYLSYEGILLDKTTLTTVKNIFGDTESFDTSENGATVLCYKSKLNSKYGVAFESGAMGSWETVIEILVGRLPDKYLKKCAINNDIPQNISDIRIGMDKTKFYSIIKTEPSYKNDDVVEYNYICKKSTGMNENINDISQTISGLITRFKNNKIDIIRVYKMYSDTCL